MIKVLQVGMSHEIGGTEKFIFEHYKAINREEVQFDFITVRDDMAYAEEVKKLGAKVHKIPSARKNPIGAYRSLLKIIEENDYDVIHINISSLVNIVPIIAAKKGKIPKIIVHSHNNGMEGKKYKFVLHQLNKYITKPMKLQRLACSRSAGEFMFGGKSFEVFKNAINHKDFKFDEQKRKEIREELGIQEDEFVIGNVGRLYLQKNQKFLIDVFAKYLKLNPKAYLLIIGQGRLEEELIRQAETLGIRDRVLMLGFKSNVKDYYNAMDMFCLPSIYEGLGIVGIEAQINGLPCIFSDKCVEEVDISGMSYFLGLEDKSDWLRAIEFTRLNLPFGDRAKKIRDYDLESNAKKLELIYKSK